MMGKLVADFTMSLDGFIAGPNDDIRALFGWYYSGDTEVPVQDGKMVFKLSRASAEVFQAAISRAGAVVTGRRDFDVSGAWGGRPPIDVPTFIVTHTVPQEWAGEGSPFTFVTDGIESALAQARQAAGDKDIAISGSTIVQQCLQAGWLDEIDIHLAPVLLGAGVRLFDHLGTQPRALEILRVVTTPDVTHLRYRVIK
jgi:dihydrofolate reductase